MANWIDIAKVQDIALGEHQVINTESHTLAVYHLEEGFYTIADCCPHQGLPLSDGPLNGTTITCPYHGAQFDIKTGKVLCPPACVDLMRFETRVENETIQVNLTNNV